MKPISSSLVNKSGIYCIINIKNCKRYIGSSINIYQRLSAHKSYLKRNCHANIKLQNSWNKNSEESFDYYILEFCDSIFLLDREQFYIDTLSPEFNITMRVDRLERAEGSKIKQSNTRKERMDLGLIQTNCAKETHQYDLNGNYIQSFGSLKKAAIAIGIAPSSIERFFSGKYKKGGGFLWSHEFVKKMSPYVKYSISRKGPKCEKPQDEFLNIGES